MRLRTLVTWIFFIAVLVWVGYTVAIAGWSYLMTQEMVDKALRDASGRHKAAFSTGTLRAQDELIADVRNSILLAAQRDALPIEAGNVSVTVNSAGVSATVRWVHPAITYGGRDILVVPVSIQRTFLP